MTGIQAKMSQSDVIRGYVDDYSIPLHKMDKREKTFPRQVLKLFVIGANALSFIVEMPEMNKVRLVE